MLQLLRNARLFAPEPRGLSDLLIADRRVAWLGPAGTASALPGWVPHASIDLQGTLLVPALIDLHAHLTGGGGEAGPGSRVPPLDPEEFFEAGIGTVVGTLGTDDTTRTMKSLVSWTREFEARGLTARCWSGGYHLPPATLTGSVRADMLWIDVVIGAGEVAISDHRSSQPTIAELRRLAAEVHVAGLLTGKCGVVHCHVGDGVSGLAPIREALAGTELPPRTFHPTHVNRRKELLREAIELAVSGSYIDLTAFPVGPAEDAWSAPDALVRFLESPAPAHLVTVSSDGGGCLPEFDAEGRVVRFDVGQPAALIDALRQTVASGVPLEAALPAFTVNPASLLRLPDKGRIAAGGEADLLALDGSLRVRGLLLGGHWRRPLVLE